MSWIVPWLVLAAAACSDRYPPELPLDTELTACRVNTDCIVVELGCCDACNGGLAVAVNRSSAAKVKKNYSERCAADVTCTTVDCGPWLVTCDAGTCAAERATDEP